METFIILVKLLIAHLCSDFFLQTNNINERKRESGIKGILNQLLHSAIHAVVAYILVAEWTCWLIPVCIFASHFLIDLVKCKLLSEKSLCTFLIDQLCHILVLIGLWYVLLGESTEFYCLKNLCSFNVWITIMAYILMLKPSSIFLSLFLDKWKPSSTTTNSLPCAGQWIGYIERILILTFVIIGNYEGVGFLLAAKSVFRFGDLNNTKEIQTTEYVLIGTLTSFTIAILTGITLSHLL